MSTPLDEILTDSALDAPHAVVITDDPRVQAQLWPFPRREYAGADLAILPPDAIHHITIPSK